MQELEYSVLQNKVDALSDVVKNNEETQVYTNNYYFSGTGILLLLATQGKI